MMFSQPSPVIADGIVSDEKLAELLGLQTEYPDLDYKRKIEVTTTAGLAEFAKDVGAFQVLGGYIIGGVDGHGVPTGDMDGIDEQLFDEATLVPKLEKYLPEPLQIRSRVLQRDGHVVVVIFIGRHPSGYAIFHTDGSYTKKTGKNETVFRAGEAFWRNGTRSERISQQGMDAIIERRIAEAKTGWVEEQQDLRQHDREEIAAAYESRQRVEAPLGSVNFDLATPALITAALEIIRSGNPTVPLIHLLNDALARARGSIERDEIESELANLLDKLTCLAATFLEYEQEDWFDRVVSTLARIYSMPLRDETDARRFGYATRIDPSEKAPRVWLLIIERVFGLGALAVRRRDWQAVRTATTQLPERLDHEYDANWLRHALTMGSRAQLINDQTSLLSLARNEVDRLPCLRPNGLAGDDEAIITSLAQFDVLSNVAAIDGASDADRRVFYTNFARFRQSRIQPIINQLLEDEGMRAIIFPRGNEDLAVALARIGEMAHEEGLRYDGFGSWQTPVWEFLQQHLPNETA